jgi:alcohol dehydrogenase (cytochrome c)
MKKLILIGLGLVLCATAASAAALAMVPELRWRAQAVLLGARGQIYGVSFSELLPMLLPGSEHYVESIIETRNGFSSITNPYVGEADVERGRGLFELQCAACHGPQGVGAVARELTRANYKSGDSDWAVFKTIRDGVSETAMTAHAFAPIETWSLVAYLRELQASEGGVERVAGVRSPLVTQQRLLNSSAEPENWLTYSGSYNGQRYSTLDAINKDNANELQVKWIHQFSGDATMVEVSPIVNDSVMYVTEAPSIVHAIDPATGVEYWRYEHRNASDLKLCCGAVNRGVAVHEDRVFFGTPDASVIALDAATGREIWKTKAGDHQLGASITSAPLVVNDLLIVGYGGGDLGFRSFLDAYSVEDGSRVWRFYTIPGEGEPGNESWAGDSWKTGGGATWLTGVYDPELELIYWGIGNPAPDFQGELREGDNLYTNCVVALDPRTGELKWYFQFTPHDVHDWDAVQVPALVDRLWEGEQRKLVLWPNRNGFYYVLDRETGEYLHATPFAKQNWAERIDENGRPVLLPENTVTVEGTVSWPSPIGAISWQSPSYSPSADLYFVPTVEYGQVLYKNPSPAIDSYEPGDLFLGGAMNPIPGAEHLYVSIRALNPETGELVWAYDRPKRPNWWKTGGLVSTAGGVVFGGDDVEFFALDANTGAELWRQNVGGRINAAPITYSSSGKQFFAMAAGRSIIAVGLP